jgi:hypothetical protein
MFHQGRKAPDSNGKGKGEDEEMQSKPGQDFGGDEGRELALNEQKDAEIKNGGFGTPFRSRTSSKA